jgi:hypothetical protein
MNEENLEFLCDTIKYLGFGEELRPALQKGLEKQEAGFPLYFQTEFGKDEVEAILHFRRSNIHDLYFFEKYHLRLSSPTRTDELIQPFHIYKGKGITLKEGYNLLCGRSVNKDMTNRDGQPYNAWLQLDFSSRENDSFKIRQYHSNYGFDLERALDALPITDLNIPGDREKLLRSLRRGNLHPVGFAVGGKERKLYLEANPRFKMIQVYDLAMKPLKEFSQPQEMPIEHSPELNEPEPPATGNASKNDALPGIKKNDPGGNDLSSDSKPKRKRISL